MNKSELVKAMAEKSGLTQADAERGLDAFMTSVQEALADGDTVALVGFGTFKVNKVAGRTGRNPRTGEPLVIAPSNAPKFAAGTKLKAAVN